MVENSHSADMQQDGVIEFHYQKSPLYRAIHCDGAYGATSPRGFITFSLFNERAPIPRHVMRKVISSDERTITAGPEEVVDTYQGVMRHIETTVFMDINGARELHEILGNCISNLQKQMGEG